MAIDTAFKRRSSAASRRMPWMRRFGIAPDGSIGQRDRTAAAWVYAGILPGVVVTVDGPGCWHTGQVYLPGFNAGDAHLPGFRTGDVFHPGFSKGEKAC